MNNLNRSIEFGKVCSSVVFSGDQQQPRTLITKGYFFMTSYNKGLWQTVTLLFLSKFVKQAKVPFAQAELISARNIELASRFAKMVGDTTDEEKIKFVLLKALGQFEKEGVVLRLSETTLQFSDNGFAKMKLEVETAMLKIAQNFPGSAPEDPPAPTVQ